MREGCTPPPQTDQMAPTAVSRRHRQRVVGGRGRLAALAIGVLCAALVGVAHPLPAAATSSSDPTGTVYVTNAGANSITAYAPGATGNAAPIRTISGAATGLNGAAYVVPDGSGNLFV